MALIMKTLATLALLPWLLGAAGAPPAPTITWASQPVLPGETCVLQASNFVGATVLLTPLQLDHGEPQQAITITAHLWQCVGVLYRPGWHSSGTVFVPPAKRDRRGSVGAFRSESTRCLVVAGRPWKPQHLRRLAARFRQLAQLSRCNASNCGPPLPSRRHGAVYGPGRDGRKSVSLPRCVRDPSERGRHAGRRVLPRAGGLRRSDELH